MQMGLQSAASADLDIRAGCVLDVLPFLKKMKAGEAVVIYHSMTMHHLRADGKEQRFKKLWENFQQAVHFRGWSLMGGESFISATQSQNCGSKALSVAQRRRAR